MAVSLALIVVLGLAKGIPTLMLAASSVDDVFVIVIFTILLGMYGGHKVNVAWQLAGIPISIVLGIIVGLIPGYLLHKLFLKYDWPPPRRSLLVIGTAICLIWLEDIAHSMLQDFINLPIPEIGVDFRFKLRIK